MTKTKIERILAGERVVCSPADMDALEGLPEADRLVSEPNPARVGTLDVFIAFLRPETPAPSDDCDGVAGVCTICTRSMASDEVGTTPADEIVCDSCAGLFPAEGAENEGPQASDGEDERAEQALCDARDVAGEVFGDEFGGNADDTTLALCADATRYAVADDETPALGAPAAACVIALLTRFGVSADFAFNTYALAFERAKAAAIRSGAPLKTTN